MTPQRKSKVIINVRGIYVNKLTHLFVNSSFIPAKKGDKKLQVTTLTFF